MGQQQNRKIYATHYKASADIMNTDYIGQHCHQHHVCRDRCRCQSGNVAFMAYYRVLPEKDMPTSIT